MPIRIISQDFTDLYSNTLNFYQSNAGDMQTIEFKILEQILVIGSTDNYLGYNALEDKITYSQGSWLVEGFRVGDTVSYQKFNSAGLPTTTIATTTIVSVSGANNEVLQLVNLNSTYIPNLTNGEYFAIWNSLTGARNEEIVVNFNFPQSGSTGNEYSFIDGEATRFLIDIKNAPNYPFFPSGQIIPATQFGLKSGQYDCFMELETTTISPLTVGGTVDVGEVSILRMRLINYGILTESLFAQNNDIKLFTIIEFARFLGEPFNRYQLITSEDANTGYFDEAYNVGVINSEVVNPISTLAFDAPTTGTFKVTSLSGAITQYGLGASYFPLDEDYYRNKAESQSELSMTIHTQPHNTFLSTVSPSNPVGANYTIQINSTSYVGNDAIVNFTFTPNADFNTFMAGRDAGDRTFQVWAKVNDVNLLVFNGQLESNPPIGGALTMETTDFLYHNENVTTSSLTDYNVNANIEDDLGYVGTFTIDNDTSVQSFTARIEAYNTLTGDEFTLLSAFFNFLSVPIQNGIYPINQQIPIINTLPTTSEKRIAFLTRETSLDTSTKYGLKIYFPFLLRWEYWLEQLNANSAFYPNQNKNWWQYDFATNWNVRLHLESVQNNLAYTFDNDINIRNYDNNKGITSEIDLIRDSTGQIVTVAIENELMRVRGTHTITNGSNWQQSSVWGMLTVEPTESQPRHICSTIVPYDNNISNPLTPINGLLCSLTFPSANVAVLECYFDSTKINLENGVSFTSKIKGCVDDI